MGLLSDVDVPDQAVAGDGGSRPTHREGPRREATSRSLHAPGSPGRRGGRPGASRAGWWGRAAPIAASLGTRVDGRHVPSQEPLECRTEGRRLLEVGDVAGALEGGTADAVDPAVSAAPSTPRVIL